jgi:hypothetical protein
MEKLKKLYYEYYRKAKDHYEQKAKIRYEDLAGRAQFEVEDTYCKDCRRFFSAEEITAHNCKVNEINEQPTDFESCFCRWVKEKYNNIFPDTPNDK